MEVKHSFNGKKGRFYLGEESNVVAEMIYSFASPDSMIIEHTEVSKEWEGKGLGRMLVKEAIEHARKNRLKVVPLCPYAKAVIHKNVEYQDVLKEGFQF